MRRPASALLDSRGKLVLLPAACLLAVWACGGDNGGPDGGGPPDRDPTPTAAGTPIDVPASQTIGPEGGTLQHPSTLLRIEVPAGAVASPTDFTIQPVTAQAPGAVTAFRLGPEGTQFALPVSLTFRYDSAAVAGSAPEFLYIGSQNADGTWTMADGGVTIDAGSNTITVQTTHLSDWTLVRGIQLLPAYSEVDPDGTVTLTVQTCVYQDANSQLVEAYTCSEPETPDGEDALPPLPQPGDPRGRVDPNTWEVNGGQGTSSQHGFVTGTSSGAAYTAPGTAPSQGNPVAVSVQVKDQNRRTITTLVSHVRVKDDLPTIHVVGEVDKTFEGIAILLGADVHDRLEFDVTIERNGGLTVSNWQNFASTYTNPRLPPGASGFCRFTIDSEYEFGTFTTFAGGASSLDEFMLQFSGTGTGAASSYYIPDDEGGCTVGVSYPSASFGNIGSHLLFEPARFDRVGAVVVVLGTGPDGVTLDGWGFQMTRTR